MKSKIFKRGFLSLIITQFFGAANDNILKMVLIYMVIDGAWKGELGSGGQGIVSLCFTVPFILLSGYAGQFADKNSKSYVSVLVKVVEIPIALLALTGFLLGNLWITLSALVALTCQSAFFGPAKYGMIPELVERGDLSRANGTINMMTNIAVIVGTLIGGMIADVYSPRPDENGVTAEAVVWLPGVVLIIVAVFGLIAVLSIPHLEAQDCTLTYHRNPFSVYFKSLKEISKTPLLMIIFAWGYFYFLAGLVLLIIPEYSVVLRSYNVSRTEVSVLMGVMGVAIGLGCVLAGLISGHTIKPLLVPIGAAGITIFFALLGFVPPTLPNFNPYWRILFSPIAAFIFGAGISAGFYIIPLQALIQRLSPEDERGQILGTANGVSFAFLALSSALYWVIRPLYGVSPNPEHPERIFLISAILMVLGAAFFFWRMKKRAFAFSTVE